MSEQLRKDAARKAQRLEDELGADLEHLYKLKTRLVRTFNRFIKRYEAADRKMKLIDKLTNESRGGS